MCNEIEEGRKLPSLNALKEVNPRDSSMEVALIHISTDSGVKMLEDKALEYYYTSGCTLELAEQRGEQPYQQRVRTRNNFVVNPLAGIGSNSRNGH